jgi:hypothetical protein
MWNDASLRWLVDPGQMPEQPTRGVQIGQSDVERFRVTVDVFATLDDGYGGGHARQALVRYLSIDALARSAAIQPSCWSSSLISMRVVSV